MDARNNHHPSFQPPGSLADKSNRSGKVG